MKQAPAHRDASWSAHRPRADADGRRAGRARSGASCSAESHGARRDYDAVIVGAGHNGLVCACYLAAAELRVCMVERRAVVGGAAVTEEFHPGFRNSTASYTVSLLNPKVIRDLRLAEHGLRIVERPFSNFLPLRRRRATSRWAAASRPRSARSRASPQRDAERLPAYYERLDARGRRAARPAARDAAQRRRRHARALPGVEGGRGGSTRCRWRRSATCSTSSRCRRRDWLERWFESEPIKACFGFDAVVGNFASPYSPGTAYVLLHHVFGEVNGKKGTWGHAIGGMGAITQAMRREAEARGVEIRTGQGVARILARRRPRARGVVLDDGTEIARALRGLERASARCCSSCSTPTRRRLARAVRPLPVRVGDLPHERGALGAARLHRAAPGRTLQPHHQLGNHHGAVARLHGPRATRARASTAGRAEPIVEMLIPSTVDDSLAPAGRARGEPLLPALPLRAARRAHAGTTSASAPPTR